MSALTAGAPTDSLVRALEKAGWGPLAGRDLRGVQTVLAALARALDPKSGTGKATVDQIGQRANYSEGWTRRCLQILEELGLVTWERGGVVAGKPVPSWFRVSKKALLALVQLARRQQGQHEVDQRAAVRSRIAAYRLSRTKPRHRKRRSVHPTLNQGLLSHEEVPRAATPPLEGPTASQKTMTDALAQMRAGLRQKRASRTAADRDSKAATTTEGAPNHPANRASETHTYASQTGGTPQ